MSGRRAPSVDFVSWGLVAAGALLRFQAALTDPGFDEIWSGLLAHNAGGSAWNVLWGLRHDNNHPLNTLWLLVVGWRADWLACRAPAIVFGVIAILAARARAGGATVAGRITTGAFAGSELLVAYSSEASRSGWGWRQRSPRMTTLRCRGRNGRRCGSPGRGGRRAGAGLGGAARQAHAVLAMLRGQAINAAVAVAGACCVTAGKPIRAISALDARRRRHQQGGQDPQIQPAHGPHQPKPTTPASPAPRCPGRARPRAAAARARRQPGPRGRLTSPPRHRMRPHPLTRAGCVLSPRHVEKHDRNAAKRPTSRAARPHG